MVVRATALTSLFLRQRRPTRRSVLRCRRDFFKTLVVNAVMMLDEDLNEQLIGMKRVSGGSMTDTLLIEGVAFKKTFSYAGFEQQPKVAPAPTPSRGSPPRRC